ncbi:hypothetical protein ARMSODRAFT_953793 [Armillaria solidipes]|uniref:Uncharacterized protein n=1 Tax=Armillaria solidipes TaxID=1076256 RepID=A0A2H3C1C4_9AGAR|nr:hypothetical protein ARMSODRAFT_953793 [Armillaria solidipes]
MVIQLPACREVACMRELMDDIQVQNRGHGYLNLQLIALPDRVPRTTTFSLNGRSTVLRKRVAHSSGSIFSNGRCLELAENRGCNGSHWDPCCILAALSRIASEYIPRCRRLLWTHTFRGTLPKLS